ncbi:hypothetical protein CYMTET_42960 [Cymbomonas tetramitiformis]|uniref:Uncharacterized protein n=1 Tax=Cymbomonas tetramitiformis TaxID=36881 RepID=A0AAE0C352_9CHLO|nr:hypothetical protein CYMTET_42960 [Cymbomonas tetramitiformis]
MDEVCATKKFTAFWWGQFLSNYGLLYFALRQAIRDGDSLMIETVQRRSVYLYNKFTGKVKYAMITLTLLMNFMRLPYRLVVYLRYNRTISLTGNKEKNAAPDI